MNLLEPWILLRVVAGVVACLLFARAAMTGFKVLRHFDLHRATEGQLALEKQVELASTFLRVGAVIQVLALALSVLGADRMSRGVRGAMCAYGVFSANEWGFRSLAVTGVVALGAAIVSQVFAFDAKLKTLELARPLAILALAVFPLSVFDLSLTTEFFTRLDLTVVASCCSVELDPIAGTGGGFVSGPRVLVTWIAVLATLGAIATALFAVRAPSKRSVVAAGIASLVTLPFALLAAVLEVAPHAFETPLHVCPFCLLRGEVYGVGYPLFGAVFLAVTWAGGAATTMLIAKERSSTECLLPFARQSLTRGALAWAVALALGAAPILRFTLLSNGASLFTT